VTPDLAALEACLAALARSSDVREVELFEPEAAPLFVARAPGRVDLMGGFADYSGSLVLEIPIREATFVAVQASEHPRVRILSTSLMLGPPRTRGSNGTALRHVELPIEELRGLASHAAAREYFTADSQRGWAAYVAGVLVALGLELGCALERGLNILIASSVPEGKGVSSSAAVEVATLYALSALHGAALDSQRAALICQRVENTIVGAPCGVMDQMTSSAGIEGQILPLLCQPAELGPCFPVPAGLGLWGIDSGLRHAVSGSDYTQVRVAAFMGYAMIARALQLPTERTEMPGLVRIIDPVYGGYLANLPPTLYEAELRAQLPERCTGVEFARSYAGISDPVTRLEESVSYRVRAATEHPIYEHRRAAAYRDWMLQLGRSGDPGSIDRVGERLGALMLEAHRSYGACGIGSSGTDRIVQLVAELGPGHGLYGAKITGGGSGGTVAVLGRASAAPAVARVAARYAEASGRSPYVFSGSSPGAAQFGIARATWRSSAPRRQYSVWSRA
jgi:galactokinase